MADEEGAARPSAGFRHPFLHPYNCCHSTRAPQWASGAWRRPLDPKVKVKVKVKVHHSVCPQPGPPNPPPLGFMDTADAIAMAREEAMRVFDINTARPNSREYWKHRAEVAEYILERVSTGVAAVEQLAQASTMHKDAAEYKASMAADMLQPADSWDAHIHSIVGLSGDCATLINKICKNNYNAYAYHRYRKKLSHEEALEKSEQHHAKRRRGLSYILGTCSRWQNKNELPFLQVALGVEMFSIAACEDLGLVHRFEGHPFIQDNIKFCGHAVCHLDGPVGSAGQK